MLLFYVEPHRSLACYYFYLLIFSSNFFDNIKEITDWFYMFIYDALFFKNILDDFNFTYTLICLLRFIYFNLKRTPSTLFIFFATLTQFSGSRFQWGMVLWPWPTDSRKKYRGYMECSKIHLIYEPTQFYFTKIYESAMELLTYYKKNNFACKAKL